MIGFGKNITFFHIVNYFARNADKVLIGRFAGAATLGLYGRAYGLLMLPIAQVRGPLTSVATPALSRLQDEPARYRNYYKKLVLMMAFLSMPITVLLGVCAREAIGVVLGDRWIEAASIFQVLALTAFIQPVFTTSGLVPLAMGQSRRVLIKGIFQSVVIVAAFAIGILWGATGVAAAYAVATYALLLPLLWYCFRETPVAIGDFFKAIAWPAIATAVMGVAAYIGRSLLLEQPDILILLACTLISLVVYLLTWLILPNGSSTIKEILSYAKIVFRRRGEE